MKLYFYFFQADNAIHFVPKENLTAADSYCPLHLEEVDSAGHPYEQPSLCQVSLIEDPWVPFISIRMEHNMCWVAFLLHVFNLVDAEYCLGFSLWCKTHRTSKANKQSLRDVSMEDRKGGKSFTLFHGKHKGRKLFQDSKNWRPEFIKALKLFFDCFIIETPQNIKSRLFVITVKK